MTYEKEIECLKGEVCGLKTKLDDADRLRVLAENEASGLASVVREAHEKIKFLEGQIEAYQYCLNSRFLR